MYQSYQDYKTIQFIEFDELRKTDLETTDKQHRMLNGNDDVTGRRRWQPMATTVTATARSDTLCQ